MRLSYSPWPVYAGLPWNVYAKKVFSKDISVEYEFE